MEQQIRELRRGGSGICLHDGLPAGTYIRWGKPTKNGVQLVIDPPMAPLIQRLGLDATGAARSQ